MSGAALRLVLALHRTVVSGDVDGWHVICACGHRERGADTTPHLATAVLAWVEERLAGAREDVARSILADDITKGRAGDAWEDGADRDWLLDNANAALDVIRRALTNETEETT